MADKGFGVKQINLIGPSGTPTIESPNNLNLNAINVAISTNLSIGGQITSNLIVGAGYSIGVGTTTPTQSLDINGNIRIRSGLFDSRNNVGAAGSILISTGAGVSWSSPASGLQGSQGTQGTQGIQGGQGSQGTQGTQGIQGGQGIQGIQGTQGLQGIQGLQGLQGTQGTQGTQGIQGGQGIQGIQGTQGLQGIQGLQGLQGGQGTQGIQGGQGIQGIQGTQGLQGVQGIAGNGGSLQSRTVVTGVTTSIANNGIGNTDITGFKSYALMKVGLSTAGWLRLYTDSASRSIDASRNQGIDPTTGSGVIAEVITTGISTSQIISPFIIGGNLNDPADTTIYAAITNLSGTTQTITANLTILQLEA